MKRETSSIPPNSLTLPVAKRDHIQGPSDAPIMLVEYGDYECPYCGEAYPIIKAIQERLGDRLCFAFRNFPLINSHPHAQHAAEAAEAAGAQGKFWEMHDLLFEHQKALDEADLVAHATALGLDAARFAEALRAHTHAARVHAEAVTGVHTVRSNPTFFLNGARFEDTPDLPTLTAAVERA